VGDEGHEGTAGHEGGQLLTVPNGSLYEETPGMVKYFFPPMSVPSLELQLLGIRFV